MIGPKGLDVIIGKLGISIQFAMEGRILLVYKPYWSYTMYIHTNLIKIVDIGL